MNYRSWPGLPTKILTINYKPNYLNVANHCLSLTLIPLVIWYLPVCLLLNVACDPAPLSNGLDEVEVSLSLCFCLPDTSAHKSKPRFQLPGTYALPLPLQSLSQLLGELGWEIVQEATIITSISSYRYVTASLVIQVVKPVLGLGHPVPRVRANSDVRFVMYVIYVTCAEIVPIVVLHCSELNSLKLVYCTKEGPLAWTIG